MGSSCHKEIYLQTMEPADDEPPRIEHSGEDITKLIKQLNGGQDAYAQITKRTSQDIVTGTLNFHHQDLIECVQLNHSWITQVKEKLSKPHLSIQGDLEVEGEIIDYSIEKHKPSSDYAISVTENFDLRFELTVEVVQRLQTLPSLKITKNETTQGLPHIECPYFIFSKQALYIGQWKFGIPGGIGIMYHQNSHVDEGEFDGGELHGYGRSVLYDGTYLQGNFFQGKMDGKGQIQKQNGFFFDGDWLNGKPHGEGEEIWPHHSTYKGSFKFGLKDGFGEQIWVDLLGNEKEVYKGEFKEGLYHGKGIYIWHNGRTYEGDWLMGKMHGKGIFQWKDGRKYEGEYQNDLKHGQGIFTWPEMISVKNELEEEYFIPKKQWIGNWKKGFMHGQGDLFFKGKHHKGIWEYGKLIQFYQSSDALNFLAMNGQLFRNGQKRKTQTTMNNSKVMKCI